MSLRRVHLLRIFLVCLGFWALSSFLLPGRAHAFVNPISITSQTDSVTFPNGIDFQMSASDASGSITQATIVITFNRQEDQEQHDATITQPAPKITVHWHEDTTGDNFTPPGTVITYYWKIQDNAGNIHTDQTQKFVVTDTRFGWQRLSEGLLQVHWYNHTADFGRIILSQATASIRRVSRNLGGQLNQPIDLWVYQTNEDFHGSLSPRTHEWVGGVAFPLLNQASIVVDTPDDDTLIRDMPHELTHLVFHQLVRNGILAPTWFDEGLAVYNQIYHEPPMMQRLKDALATHTLLRLSNIAFGFPADADQAYLAYAQSWDLVDYMYKTFGSAKMAALIKDMSSSQTNFGQDLTHALGVDQAHLENQWRLSLNQPATLKPDQFMPAGGLNPQSVRVATDSNAPLLLMIGILLVLLPPLGFGGILVYQRRNREKVRLGHQAQYIINTALPSYNASVNSTMSYTDPARYYSPPPPYQQAPLPYQPYPQGGDMRSAQTPYGSPNTPGHQWPSTPSTPATNEGGNQRGGDQAFPQYAPGQEFLNQPPRRQAPQE